MNQRLWESNRALAMSQETLVTERESMAKERLSVLEARVQAEEEVRRASRRDDDDDGDDRTRHLSRDLSSMSSSARAGEERARAAVVAAELEAVCGIVASATGSGAGGAVCAVSRLAAAFEQERARSAAAAHREAGERGREGGELQSLKDEVGRMREALEKERERERRGREEMEARERALADNIASEVAIRLDAVKRDAVRDAKADAQKSLEAVRRDAKALGLDEGRKEGMEEAMSLVEASKREADAARRDADRRVHSRPPPPNSGILETL
jgi:hypothetical protein